MTLEYMIVCDGCAGVIDASTVSAARARAAIKESGGKVGLPGGKDLCPSCVIDSKTTESIHGQKERNE